MTNDSPVAIMAAFYREVNPADIAFRLKSEPDEEWWLCFKPLWHWGVCDYKIIDIEFDDYFW